MSLNQVLRKFLVRFPWYTRWINRTLPEPGSRSLQDFFAQHVLRFADQPGYHVIVCRQFLHHVEQLESLMLKLEQALLPHGLFLVDDIVGRNGHMRWPEALALVNDLWEELPDSYKYHHLHGTTNRRYENWDCSITGYEGIRGRDGCVKTGLGWRRLALHWGRQPVRHAQG